MTWIDFRNISIRRKLTLIIMLISCSALLLAAAGFAINDLLAYRQEMIRQGETQATIIGNSSTAALLFKQPKPVEETIKALRGDRHLMTARVYDAEGQILVEHVREDVVRRADPLKFTEDGHRFEHGQLIVYHTVWLDNEKLGAVYLQMDLQSMWERMGRYAGIVSGVLLTSACVALFLSARLQRLISEPILHLEQTANRVAREKNYSIRAVKQSSDEMGRLIDGFNEMLAEIQARDAALRTEIRERTRAEEALRQSQERFSKAFEASSVLLGISTLADGRFLDVNGSFLQMFGYTRDEVIGRTAHDLGLWLQPDQNTKLARLVERRDPSAISRPSSGPRAGRPAPRLSRPNGSSWGGNPVCSSRRSISPTG